MPGQKRLLELALKGLEAERQRIDAKSPIFRSRLAAAAREGAAKPDHNHTLILSRNRLGVQHEREVDSHLPDGRNYRT